MKINFLARQSDQFKLKKMKTMRRYPKQYAAIFDKN